MKHRPKTSGWFWCCDGTGLEANVKAALKKHKKRFGKGPDSIHVRPQPELPKTIADIRIIADSTVTPNHLYFVHSERKEND